MIEFIILVPFFIFLILFNLYVFECIQAAITTQENVRDRFLTQTLDHNVNMPSLGNKQRALGTSPRVRTSGIPFLNAGDAEDERPIETIIGICRTVTCN